MTALSEGTLASLLRQAGFPEERVPLMVNIAKRESGLRPGAHNPNAATGDNSYGLFQINMIGNLGPARLKEFADIGVRSYEDLKDPWKNVQAAKRVHDSQGLGAWTTYAAAAKDPKPNLSGGGSAAGAATAAGGASAAAGGLESLLLGGEPSAAAASQPALSPLAAVALAGSGLGAAAAPRMANSAEFQQALGAQTAVIEALFPQASAPAPALEPASAAPSTALTAAQTAESLGEIGVVDLGRKLQQLGFQVAENPAFGGVGKHSPNSHHYAGHALDLTIQPGSPLLKGRPDGDWKALTAQFGAKLKQALPGAEIFHPGDDPVGGHHSHIHVALPGGRGRFNAALLGLG